MSYTQSVKQAAFDFASHARRNEAKAKKEKLRLEDRVLQLELEIKHNKAAADRVGTFSVKKDGMFQCPRCWIVEEVAADLTAIPSDDRNDKFRCTHCRDEFVFPAP